MLPKFIHLRARSSFSLGKGAIKLEDLVAICARSNFPALALTDEGNLFAALEFSLAAVKKSIQPINGVVLQVVLDFQKNPFVDKLLLLVKNEQGFKNLLSLVSNSFIQSAREDGYVVTLSDLAEKSEGLICLVGYSNLYEKLSRADNFAYAKDYLRKLQEIFDRDLYIEIVRSKDNAIAEDFILNLALDLNIPLVATNDVYFSTEEMHEAQDILSCISTNRYQIEDDRVKLSQDHYFKSQREMEKLFADLPEALENTVNIARKCSFFPEVSKPILPSFPTQEGRSEEDELRYQARDGLRERLQNIYYENFKLSELKEYYKRLQFELDVILKMGFAGYFLIVSDFIKWSKDNKIPVGPGRGSGAGSIIAWALKITDLDPLRFGLLFERFLNPQRVSMPDFDIDFCQENRDQVIDYVRRKYGAERTASIITFGKLQAKAVLKDVGRVLQMPYKQVDDICKMIPFNPVNPVTLKQAIEMDKQLQNARDQDPEIAKLLNLGLKLEGMHRHTSTHAAGIVIGDRDLQEMIPLYKDPRSDMPVVQYSMKYTELAGLVKFDFLGLKTLTTIAKALELIAKDNIEIDITAISLDDERAFALLSSGNSIGVFQLESAGMRDCLKKMRPDKLEDIIALISLYRPGPMDNIPAYLARKHGQEAPVYPHPLLEDCLRETFGVIIYQEQVMQIAQILAGYSLADADLLRRAMGKKIKAEMDAQREIFVKGALANKIEKNQASEIFDLVAKFAGYGFNKSHAAAYALIGYHTAYLKANYPVEFMTALLNMDITDTDKINFFVQEIKRMQIEVLPPSINNSQGVFSVVKLNNKKVIRYGLVALKSVGKAVVEKLLQERAKGKFLDIYDFIERCGAQIIAKKLFESLVLSGSLNELEKNQKKLFLATEMLVKHAASVDEEKNSMQTSLFSGSEQQVSFRPKLPDIDNYSNDEMLNNEFLSIGFYLTRHPLDDYMLLLNKQKILLSQDLVELQAAEEEVDLVGVIINYKQRSGKNGRFTTVILSDPKGIFEVSIFSEEIIDMRRELFVNGNKVFIKGLARKDEGGVRVMVRDIMALEEYFATSQQSIAFNVSETANLDVLAQIFNNDSELKLNLELQVSYKDHNISLKTLNTVGVAKAFFNKLDSFSDILNDASVSKKLST